MPLQDMQGFLPATGMASCAERWPHAVSRAFISVQFAALHDF